MKEAACSFLHTVHVVPRCRAPNPCLPQQQDTIPYVVKNLSLALLKMGKICPKHVELILEIDKTVIVASSWFLYYLTYIYNNLYTYYSFQVPQFILPSCRPNFAQVALTTTYETDQARCRGYCSPKDLCQNSEPSGRSVKLRTRLSLVTGFRIIHEDFSRLPPAQYVDIARCWSTVQLYVFEKCCGKRTEDTFHFANHKKKIEKGNLDQEKFSTCCMTKEVTNRFIIQLTVPRFFNAITQLFFSTAARFETMVFFGLLAVTRLRQPHKLLTWKFQVHVTVHHYCRIRKNQLDVTGIDIYSRQVNSTCFKHHYAHRQENRLYKKLLVANALLCWLQSCRVGTRAVCTV